ncbi:IclR family transcriptional regulator [Novosphingobium sp. 9]|uniref:IclR family transcriptional regulator n=1 Tax=Novosphingobium sp. 9 TaxID=2025349 RepID=UPI0021B4E4C0|nr:helix-turn-helix domain-containing protein [Novosphingobium sp. 9]
MEKGIPIRSVSRAISILQEINQMGSLSMMQIARRGGLPYPTTCRIVQTLIHEGLVEQEPARKYYRPTALVQSLSQGFRSDSMVVEHGREHIRDLTQRIGWPVSLTVRIGTHMVVRDSTHSETSLTFEVYYPGFRLPLVDSAAGRVCLANMDAMELEQVVEWLNVADDSGQRGLPTEIALSNRERIREDGYDAISWGNTI